ncbi:hypothetical protein KY290_031236 [Solanum tuberosum]|uniref:Uncharacterized protein n=1 Tax=Solanum tuberosum TaxID=4113 RepID=A0ABQ7U9T9_SOLTU|nr:hypothetical protein KY290_031236 [Solanum tuberosum]
MEDNLLVVMLEKYGVFNLFDDEMFFLVTSSARVLSQISVLGSAFLALLAVGPAVIEQATHLTAFRGFAGTSVLVVLQTLQGKYILSIQLARGKFNMFSDASALKANILKSQVCFEGINKFTKETILTMLGYEVGELCFKYLARRCLVTVILAKPAEVS